MYRNSQRFETQSFNINEADQLKMIKLNQIRMRSVIKQQRKNYQKKIFGDHYNYGKVGLNKQKKYWIQQQKNTQIERSNRILLQKLQKISKRPTYNRIRQRIMTREDSQYQYDRLQKDICRESKQSQKTSVKSHSLIGKLDKQYATSAQRREVLFNGQREIDGQTFQIKIFLDQMKWVLVAEKQKFKQKIKVDASNYLNFLQEQLDNDHQKIFEYVSYNGTLLQLAGIQSKISVSEQQEIMLPAVNYKTEKHDQERSEYLLDKVQNQI